VQTIKDALRLPYVAIALKQGHEMAIAAEAGDKRPEARDRRPEAEDASIGALASRLLSAVSYLPLGYQGETVGQLILSPRAPGEPFSPGDLRLLDDLARQASVAVHAVQLSSDLQRLALDLQRSRERLVLAREEERRRLRRDLHDDLAPTLAALALTAGAAGDLIATDPAKAQELVAELRSEIRATVGGIRRLVYDLRPPTLDELGLAAAVRERAAQYGSMPGMEQGGDFAEALRVTVEAPERLPPMPAAVEVAAYRIVQEALMNVSRHAHARTCHIRLEYCSGAKADRDALALQVVDDGVGLPEERRAGVGLRSMRERAEELGGACSIERSTGDGTRVSAWLPVLKEVPDGHVTHPDRR
jgi:signal transduction histidine kinase